MITVIRFVHIYEQSAIFRVWRFAKSPRYSLWLYFDELTDDGGPDDDGGSYDEEWLSRCALRLHGEWRDPSSSLVAANEIAEWLRARGQIVEVEDVVGD